MENTNIIRLATARSIIEESIRICFGRYYRSSDYMFDGAFYSSYELFNEAFKGAIKIRVTDADVQFMLDGHIIFSWNPVMISEIDDVKIYKHLQGWSVKDLYVEFFNTAAGLCEKFNNMLRKEESK